MLPAALVGGCFRLTWRGKQQGHALRLQPYPIYSCSCANSCALCCIHHIPPHLSVPSDTTVPYTSHVTNLTSPAPLLPRCLRRQIESLAAAASVQQAAARETELRLSQRVRECAEALAGTTEARRAALVRAEAAEGAAQAARDAAHSAAAAAAEVKAQCEAEQAR